MLLTLEGISLGSGLESPLKSALSQAIDGKLSPTALGEGLRQILSGQATDAQTACLLTCLRLQGLEAPQLVAAVLALQEFMHAIHPNGDQPLLDIVGTGGDQAGTFNVSTASMFAAAGAGCRVTKHGNRGFIPRRAQPTSSKNSASTSGSRQPPARGYWKKPEPVS